MLELHVDHEVDRHFDGRSIEVRAIYDAVLAAAQSFGPVGVEAKKTSIHLTNRTAFAGVQTRRDSLILTLKSMSDIASSRVVRREQTSANRWHLEVKLGSRKDVDKELTKWLGTAYDLSR